MNNISEQII